MTTEAKQASEAEANPEAGDKRSAARIDPILQIISKIWRDNPDLRLCQILSNAAIYSGHNHEDLYYLEDYDLYEALEKYKMFQQREVEGETNER